MPQKNIETQTQTENKEKLSTPQEFAGVLRKKFHDSHPETKLPDLYKIDAKLKLLANNLFQSYGEKSKYVFEIFSQIPTDRIEKFAQYGAEFLCDKETVDLIKQDLGENMTQETKNGYIPLVLDFLDTKKIDEKNSKIVSENNEKSDNIKELWKKILEAQEKAKKVQSENGEKFNTPEYRNRKQKIAQELESRPDFKAKIEAKLGKQANVLDLADLVATYQVVNENNIQTQSANDFRESYKVVDGMLNFGYSSARDFSSNTNLYYTNSSYEQITKPSASDQKIASEKIQNPEAQTQIVKMAMKFFPGVFKDFDPKKATPEQKAKIDEINAKITQTIAGQSRLQASGLYNGFVGGLLDGNFAKGSLGNKANIKEADKYLKIQEGKFQGEIGVLGKSLEMKIENGEIQMTNLLKKDERTNKYQIGLEKLDGIDGIPNYSDVLGKINGIDSQAVLQSLQDVNDFSQFEKAFGNAYAQKVQETLKNYPSVEQLKDKVSEQTEKYYLTTKLLGYFVPPDWDYRFENKANPVVEKGQIGKQSFYEYLDVLRNTFYRQPNPENVEQMRSFESTLSELVQKRLVDPKTFFTKFKSQPFIKPIGGENFRIDLDRFNDFAKEKMSQSSK